MKYVLSIILSVLLLSAAADTLTIQRAVYLALESHPLEKQRELYNDIGRLLSENTLKSKLPQIGLYGQISYQSDVVSFPDNPVIGIDIPKLQSKIYLEAYQIIYNAGIIDKKSRLDLAASHKDEAQIDIELKRTKEQVSAIYFALLSIQKRQGLLKVAISDLDNQMSELESRIENGVLLPVVLDRFQLQRLTIENEILDVESEGEIMESLLTTWTGIATSDKTLILPDDIEDYGDFLTPELELIDRNIELLQVSTELINSENKPMASVFFQGGMGQPNPLNFFETDFEPYYLAGLRLSWNPFDYSKNTNQLNVIDRQQELMRIQRKNLVNMLERKKIQLLGEREKVIKMLDRDQRAVELQEKILKVSKSQYDNGVINTTEYLKEINILNRLKMQRELRLIMMIKSSWDASILTGKN